MSETCQKLAFTHPIVVLKSGLKNNWMKKIRSCQLTFKRLARYENGSVDNPQETHVNIT